MGIKVRVIPGGYENLKITTPEDLLLAEVLLKQRKNEG
jgi:2-C-methyl-D-erythritol 4-phosphate cytidylyltransferase